MSKKLLIFPILVLLTFLGASKTVKLYTLLTTPNPLPYRFSKKTALLSPKQKKDTAKATVLIIGDRRGRHFQDHLPLLREKLSPLFRDTPMANISGQDEGLHRSLKKLDELPSLPRVVVFMGGHDEFVEPKPDTLRRQKPTIAQELGELIHLHFSLPSAVARLFPPPLRPVYPQTLLKNTSPKDAVARQKSLAFRYQTYELEIEQLITRVHQKNTHLILTTAPVNLMAPPHMTCSNATTKLLERELDRAEEKIEAGRTKEALALLVELESKTVGHARLFHLLGRAWPKRRADAQKARAYLAKAKSFDCDPKGPSPIFNTIIRRKAKEYAITLVDFERLAYTRSGNKATLTPEEITHALSAPLGRLLTSYR